MKLKPYFFSQNDKFDCFLISKTILVLRILKFVEKIISCKIVSCTTCWDSPYMAYSGVTFISIRSLLERQRCDSRKNGSSSAQLFDWFREGSDLSLNQSESRELEEPFLLRMDLWRSKKDQMWMNAAWVFFLRFYPRPFLLNPWVMGFALVVSLHNFWSLIFFGTTMIKFCFPCIGPIGWFKS